MNVGDSYFRDQIKKSQKSNSLERAKIHSEIHSFISQQPLNKQQDKLDEFLISVIQQIRDAQDLYLFSLAIRWGANPNLYLRTINELYERHIAVFMIDTITYHKDLTTMTDDQFNNFIVYLLVLLREVKGKNGSSNFSLPTRRRIVDKTVDEDFLELARVNIVKAEAADLMSVRDYIISNVGKEQALKIFNPQLLTDDERVMLSLFSDSFQRPLDLFSMDQLLDSRAIEIFRNYPLSYKINMSRRGAYSVNYYKIIEACNVEFFENMVMNGLELSYFDINLIIDKINQLDLQTEYFKMLLLAIEYGNPIDIYQLTSLRQADKKGSFVPLLLEKYKTPYIKKMALSTVGEAPKRLLRLAFDFNLSIERSRAELTENLLRISRTDEEDVAHAFDERYQMRLASTFVPLLKFVENNIQLVKIVNYDELRKRPNEVNDHQTIAFQGSDGLVYAFNSDLFQALLVDKKIVRSVSTGDLMALPYLTTLEISKRMELLKHYGISLSDVRTVREDWASLRLEETINNAQTDEYRKSVETILLARGYDINRMSKMSDQDLSDMTNFFGYYITPNQLKRMTYEHRWVSVCLVIYYSISEDKTIFDKFMAK